MVLCLVGVLLNLGLALFNLIPFGPLDGHWLVGLLLPEKPRLYWFRFNQQIGIPGVFVAVILLQYTHVDLTVGPLSAGFQLLTGRPLH
jgi:Zn-dependent protease